MPSTYCISTVMHLSTLPLIERKALLEPLVANKPGFQFNGHESGDGELILRVGNALCNRCGMGFGFLDRRRPAHQLLGTIAPSSRYRRSCRRAEPRRRRPLGTKP
jgi:hypothetical protein